MSVYKQSWKDKYDQIDIVREKTRSVTDEYRYFMKKGKMSLSSKILLFSILANIVCSIASVALLLVQYILKMSMSSDFIYIVWDVLMFSISYFPIINFVLIFLWLFFSGPQKFTQKDAVKRMCFQDYEHVEFSENGVFITHVEDGPHEGSAGELRRRVLYAADTVKAVHSSELGMTVIYGEVYEFMVGGFKYKESEYNNLDWKNVKNKYGKIIALSDTFKNQENGSFDIGRQISESLNVTPEETDVKGVVDFIMHYEGNGFGLRDKKIEERD